MVARYKVSVFYYWCSKIESGDERDNFLGFLGLFCKAVLRIENFISVKVSSAKLLE